MSQIFRALKKSQKSQGSSQSSQNQPPLVEEVESVKAKEKSVLKCNQNSSIPDLIQNKPFDRKIDKESKENVRIETSVDDLRQFCLEIDEFVERAQNMVDRAYTSDEQRILQRRLKNSVNELLSIQNQIKTIMDSIKSIKLQIDAVRNNVDDHKTKYADLKVEERRTRFILAQENNKREKNARNQEKSARKDFQSKIPKYYITPTVNENTRTNANSTALTNYFSIPSEVENETSINTARNSQNNNTNIRVSRPTSRPMASTIKRVKALRARKDAPLPPTPQNDPPGVTVFLRPINDSEKSANINGTTSHHSTPSTSIVNFTWFNNNIPEQTNSDTGTNSVVSASNSLFVFNSNGRIDDLD